MATTNGIEGKIKKSDNKIKVRPACESKLTFVYLRSKRYVFFLDKYLFHFVNQDWKKYKRIVY